MHTVGETITKVSSNDRKQCFSKSLNFSIDILHSIMMKLGYSRMWCVANRYSINNKLQICKYHMNIEPIVFPSIDACSCVYHTSCIPKITFDSVRQQSIDHFCCIFLLSWRCFNYYFGRFNIIRKYINNHITNSKCTVHTHTNSLFLLKCTNWNVLPVFLVGLLVYSFFAAVAVVFIIFVVQ